MQKQVDAGEYAFDRYVSIDRWASYHHQLALIFAQAPCSVLEVGIGDGIVGDQLRHAGIAYTSVDFAADVHPDIVAPITEIPVPDASQDVVCAFEVLEHLPFEAFDTALGELARISKKTALISLPHFGPSVRIEIKVPLVSRIRLAIKMPWPRKHVFNGQHYWEIGKRGFSQSRVRRALEKHFIIEKEFVPFENQYHHFFALTKKIS